MNAILKRSNALILSVLLLTVLLGACGNSNKKSTSPAVPVAPSQATTVGLSSCTVCHSTEIPDWLSNKHANLGSDGTLNSPGNPSTALVATGDCARCHDPNGDSNRLIAGVTGNVPRPVIGCEACHGNGSLHAGAGGTGPIGIAALPGGFIGTTPVSAQFNTCTSCHELLNSAGTGSAISVHDTTAPTGTANVITDTHFATAPASYGSVSFPITGYVMDFSSETVCTDCHDPHKNADIQRQWAQSGLAATAGNAAWAYINWSTRPTCQRCHTTTGFIAYADALRAGDTAQAHLIQYGLLSSSPVTSTASWKPEMLLCQGCHTDNKGSLRNPGAYTADYSYNFYVTPPAVATIYSVASHTYPDLAGSNICMLCHTGRQNGDSIKNMNTPGVANVDFSNFSFLNDHHFTAAGTLYGTGGYRLDMDGRSYDDPPFFMHKNIGSSAAPNTGTNGPCVGCHMSRTEGHLFNPVDTTTGNVDGTITNVAATVCNICHVGTEALTMSPGMLERQKALLADATSAFNAVLEQAGLYWRNGSGFYRVRDSKTISAGTVTAATGSQIITGKGTNWALVGLDPGDAFRIDTDGTWYTIQSVGSATQITLSSAYTGTVGLSAGVSYTIIKSESVIVTHGSPTVTGIGTNWLSVSGLVFPGDTFRIDSDNTAYTIASVATDTLITLTAPYSGASTTTNFFTLRNTAGLATATTGSTSIKGSNVNWITLDVAKGDYFRIDSDGTWYLIASSPTKTTVLTLTTPYAGTTVTGAYTITRAGATTNWLTRGDTDKTGNTTGKNNMGVGLNRFMIDIAQEPGAFAHNRFYTKRLIYDSIDWLDDGVLNYSTGATLNAICSGSSAPVWCSDAMSYLLPNGVFSHSSLERP